MYVVTCTLYTHCNKEITDSQHFQPSSFFLMKDESNHGSEFQFTELCFFCLFVFLTCMHLIIY